LGQLATTLAHPWKLKPVASIATLTPVASGTLLTREQYEFADWLEECIGEFEKPSDDKGLGRTSDANATLPNFDTISVHSHISPCIHSTRHIVLSPKFHCYSIQGKRGRVSRQDWASWDSVDASAYRCGIWYCDTLAEAGRHYSWRPFRLAGVVTPFSKLAADLQVAMKISDVAATGAACKNIIKWGGLTRERGAGAALRWIVESGPDLIRNIDDATNLLRPGTHAALTRFDGTDLLMDSATTKIYAAAALDLHTSPAAQDVLMYDGRVGAALCLLVRQFIKAHRSGCTPAALQLDFRCGREARRNPSSPGVRFRGLSNDAAGHLARAESARLAARIIQRALGLPHPTWQFAEFEKSLFMVGYDVRKLVAAL
jgi:hypothetical protein